MLPPLGGGERSPAGGEDGALQALLRELRADHPVAPGPTHVSHRARFTEVLSALGHLALGDDPVEPRLATACALIAETLAVGAVALLEPGTAAGRLVVRAGAGGLAGALGEELACGAGTQAGFALSQLGSTATADANASWPGDAFLARHGLAAAALAVLPGGAGPLGLLGAYEAGLRAFAPEELRFLEAAAATLAATVALHRAGLERQRIQARLAVVDRLVALGALTGGVAHELNNPLSYVLSNLSFIGEEVASLGQRLEGLPALDAGLADSARQVGEAVADARDGVEALRGQVRDLQTLSGDAAAPLGPLDPTDVLEASVRVARSELKHRAEVVLELAQALPPVHANPARLGQVFLDLLAGAAHALPAAPAGRSLLTVRSYTLGDRQVAVEVGGAAISGDEAGPDLAICRDVVVALGGELQVERRAGQGATFRVLLPVAPVEAAGPVPAPSSPGTAPRRRRILVVDDEPLIGSVIERSLGIEFEVVPLSSPRLALDRLAGGERFDLVLCDLLMPGLTGMELFEEVRRRDPVQADRMVFLTGGAFTQATRDFLSRPGVEHLAKPFDLQTLRAAVARRMSPT